MNPVALLAIVLGNLTVSVIAYRYFKKFQSTVALHDLEMAKREKELKRRVLELQVLRSLGERAGYSLDLRQILEVITDSLTGLVEFATVAYMLPGKEGRIIFKIRAAEPVSRKFLTQTKSQMLEAFSAMTGTSLQPGLIDETASGSAIDDTSDITVGSFFNLPIIIGGKVVALVNVSSPKTGLYGDEETTILYTIFNQVSTQVDKLVSVVENEKRRLSAMIGSLTDGVVMVDGNFNLIVANPILAPLLGLTRPVASLYDLVAAIGTKVDLQGAISQAFTKQSMVSLPEISLGEKAVQIDVEPVKDRFGYLLGVAVVFHDVSARKALEKLREEFTAMMVHELRTPLTTITYSIDMMKTDLPKMKTEDVSQNLGIIKGTTDNMLSLVNELLDVAKIEAGKFIVVKKEDDLAGMLNEKVQAFKALTDQKHIYLTAQIDPHLPKVSFDRNRLGQVVNNLLSNAIKYTDKGGVSIRAEGKDGQVVVSVSDTGDGIKPEDLNKLFSKFEQLGKGKTGEKGGTGLGLVVTKGIVEAHGGRIWVTSPGEGKGTTFSFSLPLGQ